MTLNILDVFISFFTERKNVFQAVMAKFACFVTESNLKNPNCTVIEILPSDADMILNSYNFNIIRDTYNCGISEDNNVLFESYDNSFVLCDKNIDKIFFSIDETQRALEHTIIIKIIYHLFFYLTKYDLFNIHCSCATIREDANNCVAFLGNKHSGKSTMVLHMLSSGEHIMCDDSLLFDANSVKAVPNVSPAKAYLYDINKAGVNKQKIGDCLSFDDNKYQIRMPHEKFAPYAFVIPKTIFIMDDCRNEEPQISILSPNEFIVETVKRTTHSEYFSNKKYLDLLYKLSKQRCFLLTPSTNSQKTYECIIDLLY